MCGLKTVKVVTFWLIYGSLCLRLLRKLPSCKRAIFNESFLKGTEEAPSQIFK